MSANVKSREMPLKPADFVLSRSVGVINDPWRAIVAFCVGSPIMFKLPAWSFPLMVEFFFEVP